MKNILNILKKVTVLLSIALLLNISVKAADVSFSLANGTGIITNLVANGGIVHSIIFNNGAAVTVNWAIYDAPPTNTSRGPLQGFFTTSYSNGAYTAYSSYLTNYTQIITNYYGATNHIAVSNALVSFSSTIAASTNAYRLIANGQVAASTSVTIPIAAPLNFVWGLTVTNQSTTNSTYRINYTPAL